MQVNKGILEVETVDKVTLMELVKTKNQSVSTNEVLSIKEHL